MPEVLRKRPSARLQQNFQRFGTSRENRTLPRGSAGRKTRAGGVLRHQGDDLRLLSDTHPNLDVSGQACDIQLTPLFWELQKPIKVALCTRRGNKRERPSPHTHDVVKIKGTTNEKPAPHM